MDRHQWRVKPQGVPCGDVDSRVTTHQKNLQDIAQPHWPNAFVLWVVWCGVVWCRVEWAGVAVVVVQEVHVHVHVCVRARVSVYVCVRACVRARGGGGGGGDDREGVTCVHVGEHAHAPCVCVWRRHWHGARCTCLLARDKGEPSRALERRCVSGARLGLVARAREGVSQVMH